MCGVIGITGEYDISNQLLKGIRVMQNRGQTSAGMILYSTENGNIWTQKGSGRVSKILEDLKMPQSNIGLGHVRYSTSGSDQPDMLKHNAQPEYVIKPFIATAHNGNIYNQPEVLASCSRKARTECDIQSILLPFVDSLVHSEEITTESLTEAARYTSRMVKGSYSAVFLTETDDRRATLFSLTDPRKIRPLVIGKRTKEVEGEKSTVWAFASESISLEMMGFEYYKDAEPGTLTILYPDTQSPIEITIRKKRPMHCMFEWIYFSNPESTIAGRNVHNVRTEIGMELARLYPVDADIVVPVPESGRLLAVGYAQESKIPYDEGLRKIKRERSFIEQTQIQREESINRNLIVNKNVLRGKKIVLTDDSIIRGTNMKDTIAKIVEAGAEEIHLRIGCPPVVNPCYLGIDMKKGEFIAQCKDGSEKPWEDIAREIGVDSIGYLPKDSLRRITTKDRNYGICTGCLDPNGYPREMIKDFSEFSKNGENGQRAFEPRKIS